MDLDLDNAVVLTYNFSCLDHHTLIALADQSVQVQPLAAVQGFSSATA
jgi:hypothetical protein